MPSSSWFTEDVHTRDCAILGAMSRTQKVILAVLAFLDALVIAALGYVIVSTQSSTNANLTQMIPDPCGTQLLEELSDIPNYRSSVAHDQSSGELHVRIYIQPPVVSNNDTRGAQSLWKALSVLAPEFTRSCPSVETLVLTVEIATASGSEHHVARFPAYAVADWFSGKLSDDELAATSQYRYIQNQADPSALNRHD